MRAVLVAAITLVAALTSFAQPAAEPQKEAPLPCQLILTRFGSQKDWWEAATRWGELKPAPVVDELNWQPPLHITQVVHGNSYYLVAPSNIQRCYVAVCGGTANICRFFQAPSANESPVP